MFAVSRFAHYLKCMVRDKIGSTKEKDQLEKWLNEWITLYVDGDPKNSSEEVKARFPLAAAKVTVVAERGKPRLLRRQFLSAPALPARGHGYRHEPGLENPARRRLKRISADRPRRRGNADAADRKQMATGGDARRSFKERRAAPGDDQLFDPLSQQELRRWHRLTFSSKIDGVDGESQDDKHKNEIEIKSFNFDVVNAGSGGARHRVGLRQGQRPGHDLTKTVDKASPNLFIGCCTGKHYPMATITCRKAGEKPHEYLVFKLTEAFVSSINTAGHDGGGVAQESLSLNFTKVEMIYTPQNADGSPARKTPRAGTYRRTWPPDRDRPARTGGAGLADAILGGVSAPPPNDRAKRWPCKRTTASPRR